MFVPKKYFKFVVFTAVALGLLAFASPADTASKKVLLVGDSLSVGYSPVLRSSDKNNSYTAQVNSGWQAKNLDSKFNDYLKCGGGGFHTVVIWAGINDIYSGVGTDKVVSSVQSMVSKAKKAGAGNVIVVNISPSGAYSKSTDKIKQQTKDVNSKLGGVGATKVVNAYSILEDPKKPGYLANPSDGLHLTGTGYGIIAKAIKSAVDSLPASSTSPTHPADACPTDSSSGTSSDSTTSTTPESVSTNFTSSFFGEVKDVCDYWKKIFDFAIKIAGGLAMLVIIIGGVVWLASNGDSAKLTKAKDLIGGALTGLFIAMTAYVGFMVLNPYLLECKIEIPDLKMITGSGSSSTVNVCDYLESYSSQADCESKEAKCGSGTSCIGGKYDDVLGLNDKWCCTAGFHTVGACPVPIPDIKKCDKKLVPKHEWDKAIIAAADRQGLDSTYVKAIMLVETGLGKDRKAEPPTGAYGIMQFQPSTAAYIFRLWKPPSGKPVPASCKKKPVKFSGKYNPDNAKSYCGSYKRSTIDTNCCDIPSGRTICERYPTECKRWFDDNPEDAIDMGVYLLKTNLGKCGNHLSIAAGTYNSGRKNCTSSTEKPAWCQSGTIGYILKTAYFQRLYCEQSGGTTETPKLKSYYASK
ncbi:MAG: transglycosylase SLT domain-containing protein [Parcubacteria group bacterium]